MKPIRFRRFFPPSAILWGALLFAVARSATDKPLLSPVFGDNMVLQRGTANPVWGWAPPGASVRVQLADATATAVADADGRWEARLQPPAPGGPYTLVVDGPQRVELHELLVGDVWLCGGQSNMELGLARARDGAREVQAADHPLIRFFPVEQRVAYGGAVLPRGAWRICSPATAGAAGGGISAVGYYFARRLQEELHVPIGLIQDGVGGTPAEAWMSPATVRRLPDFAPALAELDRAKARGGPEYGNYVMHWFDEYDVGLRGDTWAANGLDEADWRTVAVPGGFAELGVPATPAVVWFRREVVLPDPLPAGAAHVLLGVVERMETTFVNGRWVGASSWVENPRNYPIPDGVLHAGRNLVAVRVFKIQPDGGFKSPAEALRLVLGDGTAIPLGGNWKAKLSVDARPPHPLPLSFQNWPVMPSVLYQGMLAPLAPLALKGVLWYQGEENSRRARQYRTLLPAMIADWRTLFGSADLPFYVVSLPSFGARHAEPVESDWAELREAQALTVRTVPNTGLAVTIDTGDPADLHPKDKRIVGERLALCALRGAYGREIVAAGPTFASCETMPGALRIHFSNTNGGLVARGGAPGEFAIAGADRRWRRATARLEGDTVVVQAPEVPQPVAVRYAWQGSPVATLYNGAGLPAVPFRTDDWPGVTDGVIR